MYPLQHIVRTTQEQLQLAKKEDTHFLDARHRLDNVRQLVFHVHLLRNPRLEVGRVFQRVGDEDPHTTGHLDVDSKRLVGRTQSE